WAFGVAASVGVTYFITPSWFLDFSYTFCHPCPHKFHVEGPFQNDAFSPLVLTGTLIGDYTAKVDTHLITVSLNVGFYCDQRPAAHRSVQVLWSVLLRRSRGKTMNGLICVKCHVSFGPRAIVCSLLPISGGVLFGMMAVEGVQRGVTGPIVLGGALALVRR